ncbi:MAG: translation initiation factor [Blastopirellula sp.]|nr:MAG: translation initiation factor [Blastopirellula sp.]
MRLFEGTAWDVPPKCDRCSELVADCQCGPEPTPRIPPEKQTANISVEKRKKGKTVTVIKGLPAEGNDLPELLTQLKSTCGAGGAIKDECLEIQGKHLDRVAKLLKEIGFKVKK